MGFCIKSHPASEKSSDKHGRGRAVLPRHAVLGVQGFSPKSKTLPFPKHTATTVNSFLLRALAPSCRASATVFASIFFLCFENLALKNKTKQQISTQALRIFTFLDRLLIPACRLLSLETQSLPVLKSKC